MTRKIFYSLPAFFLLILAFSSCQKELSEESGKPTTPAVGSLKDSLGNCLPHTVTGTFYNGITPGSDTAYVELQVNVTTAGTYNISTDTVNGFLFADSGFFSATGINTIRLKPIGTPILPVITNFSVFFDTSVCFFSVDVKDSTGTGLGGGDTSGAGIDTTAANLGEWKFTANSKTFSGSIDTAFLIYLGLYSLSINGTTPSQDTSFGLSIILPSETITPGTYDIFTGSTFQFTNSSGQIFVADATTPDFSITITSYDSVTKVITGTFNGTVKDSLGNEVDLTYGSFQAYVE